MQLLFNLSYPSILINFTSPSFLRRYYCRELVMIFQGRFDQPLRVKTFFLRRIIARKFRLPLRCQSRLEPWFLRISIPRVFLERGSDIPDENKRIKGRHCWSFLEKRSSRDCFSLSLSRRNRSNRRRSNLPLLPSRWTNATMCISRALG